MDRLFAGQLSRRLGLEARNELPRDEDGMQSIDEYMADNTQDHIRFQQFEEDLLRQKQSSNSITDLDVESVPRQTRRTEPIVYQDKVDFNDYDYNNIHEPTESNREENNDSFNESNKENDQSPFNYVARRINFDNEDETNKDQSNSPSLQLNKSPGLNKQSPLRSPLPEQHQEQTENIQPEDEFDHNQFDNDDFNDNQNIEDYIPSYNQNDLSKSPPDTREASPSLQFTRVANSRKQKRAISPDSEDSREETQPSVSSYQDTRIDSIDETTYGDDESSVGDSLPSSSSGDPNTAQSKKRKNATSPQPSNEVRSQVESLPSPPTDGLRRSKRTRIPPVAFWRNERVIYTKASQLSNDSDDPDTTLARDIHNIPLRSIKEVVHVPEPTSGYKNRKSTKRRKRHKVVAPISPISSDEQQEQRSDEEEQQLDDPNIPGASWLKDQILQMDIPEHGKIVEKAIAYSSDYGVFQSPALYNEEDGTTVEDPNLKIATLFNDIIGNCAVGLLELKGLKPPVKITSSAYFLLVVKGSVEVTFNDEVFIVIKGCTFCIPSGNEYGLRNIGKHPALLHFVQVKDEEIEKEIQEEEED
ncbi:MIF2 [Candida pseudojiufengensis]|uniref:MIF2 n=1 Tax=Candida pseudojiufengensis TaxID=497109 RepID=UPI0022240274|nr:MIF2 [Candida pseudojiufengensis]KAI5963218.1 MIF2 [Candida pseudojiufengensis]